MWFYVVKWFYVAKWLYVDKWFYVSNSGEVAKVVKSGKKWQKVANG